MNAAKTMIIHTVSHNTGDGASDVLLTETCPSAGPVLAFAKRDSDANVVRIPDWNFYDWPAAHLIPWEDLSNVMREHSQKLPWATRIGQLFGRAAHIGHTRDVLSKYQNALAASPSWNVQIKDWKAEPASFTTLLDHCKYKYLLHTAGNTYSGRLKFLTLCGSAIIFPADAWKECWYPMLQNGTNVYMADTVTMENKAAPILQALASLQADDDLAQSLAHGAHELAYKILSKRNINAYMFQLLQKYSSLMDFQVERHPDAVPLEQSLLGPPPAAAPQRSCRLCPSSLRSAGTS